MASPQGEGGAAATSAAPVKKRCHLFDLFKPKPKCYTYTWVLKKKRCGGLFRGGTPRGGDACDNCGGGEVVYPSGQGGWASPQGGASGRGVRRTGRLRRRQAIGTPASYGAGQAYGARLGAGQATAQPSRPRPPVK